MASVVLCGLKFPALKLLSCRRLMLASSFFLLILTRATLLNLAFYPRSSSLLVISALLLIATIQNQGLIRYESCHLFWSSLYPSFSFLSPPLVLASARHFVCLAQTCMSSFPIEGGMYLVAVSWVRIRLMSRFK